MLRLRFNRSFRFNKGLLAVLALLCLAMSEKALSRAIDENSQSLLPDSTPQLAGNSDNSHQSGRANRSPIKLEGKAEFQQYNSIAAWQASQAYRQGIAALSLKDYGMAADYFRQAGNGFATSTQAGKYLAEARYAEGQARRLLKQNAQAAHLFAEAVQLFGKYDQHSPYLKAAVEYRNSLTKSEQLKGHLSRFVPNLRDLPAQMDTVDRHILLTGKLTKLEDGTKLTYLKDDDFFNGGSKRLLSEAAAVDVSDPYVHNAIYKAFLQMNCLEWAELGGNYYTAPDNYAALKSSGKTVVIGASDQFWSPIIKLFINGHQYGVCMDLPGMSAYSHNVLVVTDGQHVLAIDPRTYDTWKLTASFAKRRPDFAWSKLTHVKKPSAISGSPSPATAQ